MADRSVTHATFTLERVYDAAVPRVFAVWAEPAAKARWFAVAGAEHELDFRIGGREVTRARIGNGRVVTFETLYRDIVPGERIVYASTLSVDGTLNTVSITTVELEPAGSGTRLRLVEQGTYLDGQEQPSWREEGTAKWLDALGAEVTAGAAA